VARHRRRWRVWQRYMDAARFVFLDETGLNTKMTRLYGRCPRGERLVGAVPHGHWRTTTFIAGLRQSGVIAPMVLDGPMTGAAFRAYIEQALAPALKPGDVVVMDNLAPQSRRPCQGDRRGRGQRPLPAALQSRPQPDRAVLRQTRGAAAQSRRPHQRGVMDRRRPTSRPGAA
jgi:hypothetical protein